MWLLLIPALCLGLVFAFVLPPTAAEAAAEDYTLVGDVNGDGKASNADVTLLTRYVAGWTGYDAKISNMDAADIDRDGQVNDTDVTLLSRAVKGWTDPIDYWATYIKEVIRVETGELRIEKEPEDHWRDEGDTAAVTFTVVAAGGRRPYSYQWYYTGRTGATAIPGATRSSYTYTGSTAWTVWCVITDADDAQVTSRSATVDRGLYVTTQPVGGTLTDAAPSLTLTTAAAGGKGRYKYQWYKGGNLIGRATSASYTATAAGSYYCIITSSDQTAQTDTVQVTDKRSRPLTITQQPKHSLMGTTLSVSVSGGTSPIYYQWYYDDGAAVSGATYSIFKPKLSNYGYYCEVTDSSGTTVISDIAYMYIAELYFFQQPKCPSQSVGQEISVTAGGGLKPYSYQWYKEGSGAIRGATADTYTSTSLGNYYCKVTDSAGTTVTSDTIGIINEQLRITKQPVDTKKGAALTVEVAGGKAPYTYVWYVSAGETKYHVADTTSPSLNTADLTTYGYYYCEVTDSGGAMVTSDRAYLYQELKITKQPVDRYVKVTGTTTLDIETAWGCRPVTCQWEKWTGSLWRNFRTGTSVRVDGTQLGIYRCIVTDKSGAELVSNTVTVAEDVLRIEHAVLSGGVSPIDIYPQYVKFDVAGSTYPDYAVKVWLRNQSGSWSEVTDLYDKIVKADRVSYEYKIKTENKWEGNWVVILAKDQDGGFARYFKNCTESIVPDKYKTW